jgi:hypothetical protein
MGVQLRTVLPYLFIHKFTNLLFSTNHMWRSVTLSPLCCIPKCKPLILTIYMQLTAFKLHFLVYLSLYLSARGCTGTISCHCALLLPRLSVHFCLFISCFLYLCKPVFCSHCSCESVTLIERVRTRAISSHRALLLPVWSVHYCLPTCFPNPMCVC